METQAMIKEHCRYSSAGGAEFQPVAQDCNAIDDMPNFHQQHTNILGRIPNSAIEQQVQGSLHLFKPQQAPTQKDLPLSMCGGAPLSKIPKTQPQPLP